MEMMSWYTADEHLNHSNIRTLFVFRDFPTTAAMNAELIRRHNERVKPGHTCYHLGDFKVSTDGPTTHELIGMLNGNHVFIRGNHDKNNGLNTPLRFACINSYGRNIVLAHKPDDADFLMGLLGIDLGFCGHIHQHWKFKRVEYGDLVNVGVDVWDYYPIDAKQIMKALKGWIREGRPVVASGQPDEAQAVQGSESGTEVKE